MSLRRKHSGVEMAGIVRYIGRIAFSMSMTFLFIALGVLAFIDVGIAERVVLYLTVWINLTIGFGSVLLMWKMNKSDAEWKQRKAQERNDAGHQTIEQWLDAQSSEHDVAGSK